MQWCLQRRQSVCLWLVSLFFLLTTLKQFIHLKWPLNILNYVPHSHLPLSSQIKHDGFFLFFVKGDRHIPPPKKTRKDWDFYCCPFSNLGFRYINYNGYIVISIVDKVSERIISLEFSSYKSFFTPGFKIALKRNG